jgi:hypothetical protein
MNPLEALTIVQSLADGIDPLSGEVFSRDNTYQDGRVIRALCQACRALEYAAHRERRSRGLPANAGKPWGEAEDSRLEADFDAGATTEELAKKHQRTRMAIQARLEKLGRIAAPTPSS